MLNFLPHWHIISLQCTDAIISGTRLLCKSWFIDTNQSRTRCVVRKHWWRSMNETSCFSGNRFSNLYLKKNKMMVKKILIENSSFPKEYKYVCVFNIVTIFTKDKIKNQVSKTKRRNERRIFMQITGQPNHLCLL